MWDSPASYQVNVWDTARVHQKFTHPEQPTHLNAIWAGFWKNLIENCNLLKRYYFRKYSTVEMQFSRGAISYTTHWCPCKLRDSKITHLCPCKLRDSVSTHSMSFAVSQPIIQNFEINKDCQNISKVWSLT